MMAVNSITPWNCGIQGPTRKQAVRKMREQQLRNAFLLLLFSQGIPLIYGGDEFGNSQEGNNNAWCQDNPVGWINWKDVRKNEKTSGFCKRSHCFSTYTSGSSYAGRNERCRLYGQRFSGYSLFTAKEPGIWAERIPAGFWGLCTAVHMQKKKTEHQMTLFI